MTKNNGHDMGAAEADASAADPLEIPAFLRRQKVETIPMTPEISQAIAEADAPRATHVAMVEPYDDIHLAERPTLTATMNENWKAATDKIEPPPPVEEAPPTLEDLLSVIRKLRAKIVENDTKHKARQDELREQIKILKRQADKMWRAI